KALPARAPGGCASAPRKPAAELSGDGDGDGDGGGGTGAPTDSPALCAADSPACVPSLTAESRENTPRHAPAERTRSAACAGRKAPRLSFQANLPRDCEKRCTLGVRPPDIRSRSHRMRLAGPAGAPEA